MSTIQTINNNEDWLSIRTKINTNLSNLNTDKAELSGSTFTGDISVPDEAYGVGWNWSMEVPTKNAIYDKIETMWGGWATTFLWLTDTPSSYSGQAGKFAKVNTWETALEFVAITGWDLLSTNNLSDVANVTTSLANLRINKMYTNKDFNHSDVSLPWVYGMIGTPTNWPVSGEAMLIVMYDGSRVMQMAIMGATGTQYTRIYAGTWSSWVSTATGSNTGDETTATIKTKLGITTLSGSNTWDETTTTIWTLIYGATAKTTPVDADMVWLMDSAASNILKKLSWVNIKDTLKTYFDTIYQAAWSYITIGWALWTPSSGTLTNCTFPTLNQDTTGSALYWKTSGTWKAALAWPWTGTTRTYTWPDADATLARTDAAQTFTGTQTFAQIICTNNAITASGNAATVPVTYKTNTVTNNSAATLTITLTTSGAVDRQIVEVLVLDATAVAQTISWVNTENSTINVPTTSNGSTTLPLSILFQFNSATSKWRCIAYS